MSGENNRNSEFISRPRAVTREGIEAFRKWSVTGGIYAMLPMLLWAISQLDVRIDERIKASSVTKSEMKEITASQSEMNKELLLELKRLNQSLSVLDKRTAVLSAVIGQKSFE